MNTSKFLPIFLFLALVACGPDEPPVVNLEPPTVTSVTPNDGATDVSAQTNVTATVSRPNGVGIDNATLGGGVQLTSATGESVPGTASAQGDRITFSPADDLTAETRYTFMVTSALEDERGAAFEPFSSSFTTAQDPPVEAPAGKAELSSQELVFSAVQGTEQPRRRNSDGHQHG